MSRELSVLKNVVVIILIIGIACGLLFRPTDDTKGFPDAIWGQPVQFENDSVMLYSSIEQVVSDGKRVYVLYTSRKGIIQVFDPNGNYLYSWRIFPHINGAFKMAVSDNVLYVRDYHADIYVFKEGIFVEFLTDNAADAISKEVQYSTFEENTAGYEIKNGAVWYVDGETKKCIVNRPVATEMYQNNIDKFIMVILFSAISMMCYFRKNKA